jgi:hypothetical protein
MKLIYLLLGLFLNQTAWNSRPALQVNKPGKNIDIEILITKDEKGERSKPCLSGQVLLINHTDTAASFFEDWNSWGYYNLRFKVTTGDSSYFIFKKDRDWPKNVPTFKTLFPGDSMSLSFSIAYDYCPDAKFSKPANVVFVPTTTICAVYQQSEEALKDAGLKGEVKYKKVYKATGNRRDGNSWIVIDSLKRPVEINRTFTLTKLESKPLQIK